MAKRIPIDHRTDVYSLGVTLYELLTLRPAFTNEDRHELLQQIAFEEPAKPRRLDRAVPAELETIVLKAMEKRPHDRYGTAQELANDLRCWLLDQPIHARRPTLRRRLARWGRRHKVLVQSAVVVLLLAVVGLAVSAALIERAYEAEAAHRRTAEEKATEANAVRQFLVNDLLGSVQPERARGKKVTVEEALANAEKKIEKAFHDQPRVEAAIRETMGVTYMKLSRLTEAERHLQGSRELFSRCKGPTAPETLSAMNNLASVLNLQGRREEARRLHEETLSAQRKVLGEDHVDTLKSMNNLAGILRQQGKWEQAQRLYEQVLSARRKVLGDDHPDTLSAMSNLASVLNDQGRWEEARQLFEETLTRQRSVQGEDHPGALNTMNNLAIALGRQGKREEALRLLKTALELARRVLGDEHSTTLIFMSNVAVQLAEQGKLEEARPLFEKILALNRKMLGEDHPDTLMSMGNLACVLKDQNELEEARRLFEENLSRQRRRLGEGDPDTLITMMNLADLLRQQGHLEEAKRLLEKLLLLQRKVQGENHPDRLNSMYHLASVLSAQGKWEQARLLFENVLELRRKKLGENHPDTVQSICGLAWLLANCGDSRFRDTAQALQLAAKATDLSPDLKDSWKALGAARYRVGDWTGARKALNKSLELHKGRDSTNGFFLAMTYWQMGEKSKARDSYGRAVGWMDKNASADQELLRFRAEAAALIGVRETLKSKGPTAASGKSIAPAASPAQPAGREHQP